jgi:hypothetical protein
MALAFYDVYYYLYSNSYYKSQPFYAKLGDYPSQSQFQSLGRLYVPLPFTCSSSV